MVTVDKALQNDFMKAYLIVDSYVPKTEQTSIERVYVSSQMTSSLGICKTKRKYFTGETKSEIGIASRVADKRFPENMRVGTLIHEILHSFFPTDHHGGNWKKYADLISKYTEYDIKRLATEEESEALSDIAKYQVRCTKCGEVFGYQRLTDVVKNPQRYHHTGTCGGNIERVK